MKWLDIIKQYYSTIIANPDSHFVVSAFTALIVWAVFLYLHRNKVSTLEERIKLKDDQIDYYKNMISANEKENPVCDKASNVSSIQAASDSDDESIPKNNIRQAIIKAVEIKGAETGRASAMETINFITPYYRFGVVLSELISMNSAGLITWEGAPNLPEHWATLSMNRP